MEVKVLSYTTNPEITCAVAMRATRTNEPAHALLNGIGLHGKSEWITQCKVSEDIQKQLCLHPKSHAKCQYNDRCAVRLLLKAKQMKHWGVFEHATFSISVKGISRACSHQLVRHRQNSFLQQSQREVKIDTTTQWWVLPSSMSPNKIGVEYYNDIHLLMDGIARRYNDLIRLGVPEEDARFVLPNACKTNIVITANARQWLHIFKLRLAPSAQWEIREMCQLILTELMKISPVIFEGAGRLEV